jgi:hypothetical protein
LPYPTTNPSGQQNFTQDHFSTPDDNPPAEGYPPRGKEYQSSYPPVKHDLDYPRAVPSRRSSSNLHETRATSSYPLHAPFQPPPPETSYQSQPHQQEQHEVTYTGMPGQFDNATDLNVPPPPSSNNQNPTPLSEHPVNELGGEEDSSIFMSSVCSLPGAPPCTCLINAVPIQMKAQLAIFVIVVRCSAFPADTRP